MSSMSRRGWVVAVGAGAAALGAGAWWQDRRSAAAAVVGAGAAGLGAGGASAPGTTPSAAMDASALTPIPTPLATLDGRTLTAADIAGRAVVLNFWAPWCPPCVREMPELDRFARSEAGRHTLVIGLAIDEQAAVDKFLTAHPVGFPISVLGYGGLARVRQLSNDANVALPFSAVFDRSQRLVQRKFGPTTAAELSAWTSGF